MGSPGCPEEVDNHRDKLCRHAYCEAAQVKDEAQYDIGWGNKESMVLVT